MNIVLGSVLRALGAPARSEALAALFRDPREAPLWVFLAIVGGGFTEELILKRRRAADSMVVHAIFDLFGVALAYFLCAAKR